MNKIERLLKCSQTYEGYEINRPAPGVYYLPQRPLWRPANVMMQWINGQAVPVHSICDEYGEQPQTHWFWAKHGDTIVWVGQIRQLNVAGDLMYLPATTIRLRNGKWRTIILYDTSNVNEGTGVCYYNGKWYFGERSGGCLNFKTPEYPRGGGLWESDDGLSWARHLSIEDPLPGEFGRELNLATMDGHLYGFYQGWSLKHPTRTLVRRLNTNENICESVNVREALVPYQLDEGFAWQGLITLRTGGALGLFDGSTITYYSLDDEDISDLIPIGVHGDALIFSGRVETNEYSIFKVKSVNADCEQIADNWMSGNKAQGCIDGDYVYIGCHNEGYAALDRLYLGEEEEEMDEMKVRQLGSKQFAHDHWMARFDENVTMGRPWYIGFPYTWWYGLGLEEREEFSKMLWEHLDPVKEPLWWLFKYNYT